MDLLLIPGFWLDGASWEEVAAPLREAGHTVHALTLPGLESADADRTGVTLRDHVDAVVAVIDSLAGPVVLVGHSGGGALAHAAVDARPGAVARVVYVDSGPLGAGDAINTEMLRSWMAEGHPYVAELARVRDVELVDLPTGHWPQLTRPKDLAAAILAAVGGQGREPGTGIDQTPGSWTSGR